MKIKDYRISYLISWLWIIGLVGMCKTPQEREGFVTGKEKVIEDAINHDFFRKEGGNEIFRVYLSSDFYLCKQYGKEDWIARKKDPGGDNFARELIVGLNKIDEEREGVVKVTLYPRSGAISKIRPIRLTFLEELDRVMVEDLQRWQFNFPKRTIRPLNFFIRFRFKLKNDFKKEKTLEELEQEYLDKNPQFYKYLMKKKRKRLENSER